MAHNIEVRQPTTFKNNEDEIAYLKALVPELIVVAAYGKILPPRVLNIPPCGCINVHGSLLPKYRGAAPIQWAVLNGDKITGVTIMQMNAGLDTGDMLYQKKIPITSEDTFETLHDKLMVLGGEAITEALPLLEAGKLTPEKQDDAKTCYAAEHSPYSPLRFKPTSLLHLAVPGQHIVQRGEQANQQAGVHEPNAPRACLGTEARQPGCFKPAKPADEGMFSNKPANPTNKNVVGHLAGIDDGRRARDSASADTLPDKEHQIAPKTTQDDPDRQTAHEHKADDAADHEEPVHRRVEQLSELRHAVRAPRKLAVDPIGASRQREHERGEQIVAVEQQHHVHRHHAQPDEGYNVRNGEDSVSDCFGFFEMTCVPYPVACNARRGARKRPAQVSNAIILTYRASEGYGWATYSPASSRLAAALGCSGMVKVCTRFCRDTVS